MRRIKLIILITFFMIGLLPGGFAVSKAEYSREYVIDDQIFKSSQTMSASAINDFFRSHGSWMTDYVIPEYISVPYPLASGGLGYASAHQVNYNSGAPLHSKTIAQLIYDEATEHGVNPRVILVVLQKESSAITRTTAGLTPNTLTWPLFYMYNESMESCLKYGTYCDDATYRTLAEDYGGVGLQIAYATNWFSLRQSQYDLSKNFTVTVDGVTFTCQNASTRILYIYTPHISSWLNFHTIFTDWWEDPTYGPPPGGQPYLMQTLSALPAGSWYAANSNRIVSGNFDADSISDMAAFYDYGNCEMGLFIFESSNGFLPRSHYFSGPNNWCLNKSSNLANGNFDNDGRDDLAILYNYASESVGIWLFKSSQNFAPTLVKYLPQGSWQHWSTSEISTTDYDNDGLSDILALYDYGGASMGVWAFESSSIFTPRQLYLSGPSSFELKKSKGLVSGNFDGDSYPDLATLYDYNNGVMGVVMLNSSEDYKPVSHYSSAPSSWNLLSASNLIVGLSDNLDAMDDLALMYGYDLDTIALFECNSIVNYAPAQKYWSGRKNFSFLLNNGKITWGDFDSDGKPDIATMYSYGGGSMALFSFKKM